MLARHIAALMACAGLGLAAPALAQDKNVKIGVLNDMSSLYADIGGPNSVAAIKMAVEDSGLPAKGWTIEVLSGDHQNKPDIGVNIARQWIDSEKVDAIADTPNSGVALAVSNLVREKNAILLNSGAATADLTGKACTPNTISFTYDTYMLATGTGKALTQAGGDTWFFLTSDYAFGHALERDASGFVTKAGGKVVGAVRHPLGASDFSSYLLQAQSSKAKVIALANAGGDTVNSLKQATEFGVGRTPDQRMAALLMLITDVHSLGLSTAQGIIYATSFSWTQSDATRAFGKRFMAMRGGQAPTMIQAGVYSAVKHYLQAIKAADTDDANAVAAAMRKLPVDDFMTDHARIREDGQVMRNMYLVQVKSPAESHEPWDYEKVIATIPPEEAWRPLAEGGCDLVKGAAQ
jgi:branched-chain amino acid transport system substrate-binding protein